MQIGGLGRRGGLKTGKGRDISKEFPQCRKKPKPNSNCINRLIVCVATQMFKVSSIAQRQEHFIFAAMKVRSYREPEHTKGAASTDYWVNATQPV